MNTITVYGRLSSDVEVHDVGGANVATFSLAGNTRRKDKQTNEYITNFYRVNAWRQMADTASRFLRKGNRVCISGELVIRPYTDKDGVKRQAIELDATGIDLVETKAESEGQTRTQPQASRTAPAAAPANFTPVEIDEGLPF